MVRVWLTPRPRLNPDHTFALIQSKLPSFTPPVLMLVGASLQYNLIKFIEKLDTSQHACVDMVVDDNFGDLVIILNEVFLKVK